MWRLFRIRFDRLPGERPESYWTPALGHVCSLQPGDIGELTPAQLMACGDQIKEFERPRAAADAG